MARASTHRAAGRWLAALATALVLAGPSVAAPSAHAGAAQVDGAHVTIEEALALAFPGCDVEKRTVYLTDAQRADVERRLGIALESAVARPYVARVRREDGQPGALAGVGWIDSHRVRTLKETLLFAVSPEGRITRLEVLAFHEPPEYRPKAKWYAQFLGRALDDELELGRAIRPVAGATLSARATVDAARRSLALHAVLFPPTPPEPPPPEPRPRPEPPQPRPAPPPAPSYRQQP